MFTYVVPASLEVLLARSLVSVAVELIRTSETIFNAVIVPTLFCRFLEMKGFLFIGRNEVRCQALLRGTLRECFIVDTKIRASRRIESDCLY